MIRLEDILKLIILDEEITLYDSGNNVYLMISDFKDLIPSKYHNWFVTNITTCYEGILIAICEPCERE